MPSLSMRSMECDGDGRGPTSAKNVSKERAHSSQTRMPREAYQRSHLLPGLHRCFILHQARYSGVILADRDPDWPCVRLASAILRAESQPQLRLMPRVRFDQ